MASGAGTLLQRLRGRAGRKRDALDPARLDPDDLPWMAGAELLAALGLAGQVAELARLSGYPESVWGRIGQPLVEGFAEQVQLVPAGDAGRYGGPGGLLGYSLQLAVRALRVRQGRSLPPGVAPEEEHERRHRWTYGVLVGALLHDVGGTVTRFRLRPRREAGRGEPWTPLSPPWAGAGRYGMERVEGPRRSPPRVAPLIAGRLVPPLALGWVAEDLELLNEFCALLYGDPDDGGALATIIEEARCWLTPKEDEDRVSGRVAPPASRPAAPVVDERVEERVGERVGMPSPPSAASDPPPSPPALPPSPPAVSPPPEPPADAPLELLPLDGVTDAPVDASGAAETGGQQGPRPRPLSADLPERAIRFLEWLQHGIREGSLPLNVAGARVHRVAEGLLLVSPAIFQDAATALEGGITFKELQRATKRVGLMKRLDGGIRTDIIGYRMKDREGRPTGNELRGMVILDPERFFDGLPPPNPALDLAPPEGA